MARVTAGVATSHVPAIGAAVDLGKTQDDYWKPLFAGYEFSKEWIEEIGHRVDRVVAGKAGPDEDWRVVLDRIRSRRTERQSASAAGCHGHRRPRVDS